MKEFGCLQSNYLLYWKQDRRMVPLISLPMNMKWQDVMNSMNYEIEHILGENSFNKYIYTIKCSNKNLHMSKHHDI